MKNIFISIGLFLVFQINYTYSQDYPCTCMGTKSMEKYFEDKLTARIFIYSNPGSTIQFFNDWMKGDVFLTDSTVVKNKNLRYRGFGDQLIWARNSDFQTGIVDRDIVSGFVLYNKDESTYATFKNLNIKNRNDKNNDFHYLQVLEEGDVSFYAYKRISIEKNTQEMFEDYIYYLYINEKFIPVKLKRSTLIRLLPEDKEVIRSILKNNKLSTRNEKDMIKAVNLYNAYKN